MTCAATIWPFISICPCVICRTRNLKSELNHLYHVYSHQIAHKGKSVTLVSVTSAANVEVYPIWLKSFQNGLLLYVVGGKKSIQISLEVDRQCGVYSKYSKVHSCATYHDLLLDLLLEVVLRGGNGPQNTQQICW